MRINRWKCFIGGMLAVAVFAFAMISPTDALAKNNGNGKGNGKIPPGQLKKISFTMMGDVYGHWAAEPVTAMQRQGIIVGFPDGKFYPQKEVSKNEALVMLMRAMGYEDESPTGKSLKLVPKSWASGMVALALDKGIITREELKNFNGNEAAQRYEVAVWLARALSNSDMLGNLSGGTVQFIDAGKIPGYAKNYVAQMARAGIMRGYPGNVFKPQNPVQRAEIAAMLFRCQNMFSLNPRFEFIKGTVDDVMPSDPAFISIVPGSDDRLTILVQVADDAAIFVDGEAVELEDIERGYAVSLVLNSARKAIVVSAGSEGAADNDDENKDEAAPEVVKLNPKDGAGDVKAGIDELVVTFDEKIYPVKSLKDIKDKIGVENITKDRSINIGDVEIDGRDLIIELKVGLEENCRYAVYIPANIIKDKEGNKFAGINSRDWRFATFEGEDEDEDAPKPEKLNPKDGAKVEYGIKKITVKFDEPVQWVNEKSSKNTAIVFNTTTNALLTPDDVNIDEDQLVIEFDKKLPVGEYGITISSGIIEDLSGNKFPGIGVNDWVFEVVEEDD
ncbi:Ig-like domain-containing protein [Desulfallas thermosapovorans]|uniref:S-layer family protein n=1 Tax=Desulfallas thermosapovorans DSM 6562 TaxID=1121431 RepID=A0A5S4ZY75_9FIRM|nr:Ig-like domain-containing protein [Desulfallas thermosapovorans]TYO97972.1 S-layer family protein [Desulfallas thermosapovorans DSM 6562]